MWLLILFDRGLMLVSIVYYIYIYESAAHKYNEMAAGLIALSKYCPHTNRTKTGKAFIALLVVSQPIKPLTFDIE